MSSKGHHWRKSPQQLKNNNRMCGDDNPAKRAEVRKKISDTVIKRWKDGCYGNRINGMHKKDNAGNLILDVNFEKKYRIFAEQWHDFSKCFVCNKEGRIVTHHVDETHDNWTLTNLMPVCDTCQKDFHASRQPFITISKQFGFEAAHSIPNSFSGLCDELHGHSYVFSVSIRRRLNENGMVIDYSELSVMVKNKIINIFDHTNLNNILEHPTAERIAVFIWDVLEKDALLKGMTKITVKETANSSAEITADDIMSIMRINKLNFSDRLINSRII